MAETFYPFLEDNNIDQESKSHPHSLSVKYSARIAVYDDIAAAPRVVVVSPKPIHDYLEEITLTTTNLSHEQGGTIPWMVIREIVENLIHAAFIEPIISILDKGLTICFSDQGPGIREKERALQFGTSSATKEMKKYIRGVGAGLPYAQQYMAEKGGILKIEDNILGGTIVTISMIKSNMRLKNKVNNININNQEVIITKRETLVLSYLAEHSEVGPLDLTKEYGASPPTWSRVLSSLQKKGFVFKHGQKRRLTPQGYYFVESN